MVKTFRQLLCERGGGTEFLQVILDTQGKGMQTPAAACSPQQRWVGPVGGRQAWAGDSASHLAEEKELIAWKRWGNPWHRVLRRERAERPVFKLPTKPKIKVSKKKFSDIIQTHSKHNFTHNPLHFSYFLYQNLFLKKKLFLLWNMNDAITNF